MRFLITGMEWRAILDGEEANRNTSLRTKVQ
jgi:hypothetical protein